LRRHLEPRCGRRGLEDLQAGTQGKTQDAVDTGNTEGTEEREDTEDPTIK
jgi:hypothetical protein